MRSSRLRRGVLVIAGGLGAGLLLLFLAYRFDIRSHYTRIDGRSRQLESPYGDIEYSTGGVGMPVLVVHGAGGGFDQAELLVSSVLDEEFFWIAPSRFGYLGSSMPMPEGREPTWDDQAAAYAYLLDSLEVEKVAVVALSQGGASALLFAALYPERVSSLTCLSCGVAHSEEEVQAGADRKGDILAAIFNYDFPYWLISRLFRSQFMKLMGAHAEVVARLTVEQREIVEQVIAYMNPVAPRSRGARFDNQAMLPGERVASISAPVLIIHAEDDTLQLFHNAEFAATHIPSARLLSFTTGGHVLMAVEQEIIRNELQRHVREHAAPFVR